MPNALQAGLRKLKVEHVRIDGGTKPEDRQLLVGTFQSTPAVRVALLSIRATGQGLTLTAARAVVFAELSWNVSELKQAEDRL